MALLNGLQGVAGSNPDFPMCDEAPVADSYWRFLTCLAKHPRAVGTTEDCGSAGSIMVHAVERAPIAATWSRLGFIAEYLKRAVL